MSRASRVLIVSLVWLSCVGIRPAVSSTENRGTSAIASLNLVPGAKETAMGQTGINETDGAEAVYWNPANIGENGQQRLFLSHSLFIEETAHSFAAYTRPLRGGKGFGVGVSYFDAGSILQVDDVGQTVGDFTPRDMVGLIGFSIPWGRFRGGVSGKYVTSKIIHSASVFTGDAGLSYQTQSRRFRWALTGQNITGHLKYVDEEHPLPRVIRLGVSGVILPKLKVSLEETFPRSDSAFLSGGSDFFIGQWGDMKAFARAGYSQGMSRDRDELSGLTLGAGFKLRSLDLDYAWTLQGELGQTHLFSMNFKLK